MQAQQTAAFSEYNYNPFVINAAYAGMLPNPEATTSYSGIARTVEGSPTNFSLSFNMPMNDGKMGFGAGMVRDQIGVSTNTDFFAAYSYKIRFDVRRKHYDWQIFEPGVLSFGIAAGVKQFQENLLDLNILGDPAYSENINANIPTVGMGVLYNHESFYAGFSIPNLLGDNLASRDDLQLTNAYYGYFGYRIFMDIFSQVMIKPNLLLKYENGAPLQADLNLSLSFMNKFEVGAGYRTTSSVNAFAGVYIINHLRLLYQYNMAIANSPVRNVHGLVLSYRFGNGYRG